MAYIREKKFVLESLNKDPELNYNYFKAILQNKVSERSIRQWIADFKKITIYTDSTPSIASTSTTILHSPIVNDTKINDFESVSKTNQYEKPTVMSALKLDGTIMTLKEYCEHYGLDFSQARSYKLITHTGTPYYNFASHNINEVESGLTPDEIKDLIREDLASIKINKNKVFKKPKVSVVKLADLHCGAFVQNLMKTKEYSLEILAEKLTRVADIINDENSSEVHIHLLGDLIESFTGLNHKNSWRGIEQGMIGAEVVKTACRMIHDYLLSRIHNLETIKIIAGNHDRVTSDKKEDVDGDAANLISWGLSLMGYDVEFNPFVINHVVDGISHILLHGDQGISKKSTKDICWDYGKHGIYNLICEGHLHSIIEKLSLSQQKNFQTIKDDAIDHRRMHCPSLFTGNIFSERLGYTSNSGFVITRNNGKGIPHIFYYAI